MYSKNNMAINFYVNYLNTQTHNNRHEAARLDLYTT